MIHAISLVAHMYRCSSCSFTGTLEQGIEHVVKNQFTVRVWINDLIREHK